MFSDHYPPTPRDHSRRRAIFGCILAGIGILLLLQMLHLLPPVTWSMHFGWPLILIIIGIAVGLRSRFRNHAWWILILIGCVHFLPPFEINGVPSRRIIWPSLLIVAGLLIILRRNQQHHHRFRGSWQRDTASSEETVFTNGEDMVDIDVLFSGRKEYVTSRNFKGGRVAASFSGVELNLTGADAVAPMVLDVRISFASIELIVPAHWEIQNEVAPTMGSVEDQRRIVMQEGATERKLLIIRGTCTFGSLEIKSF